jgi:hypothetical protein
VVKLLNKVNYEPQDIEALNQYNIENSQLQEALSVVMRLARSYSKANDLPIERIAKSRDFVEFLLGKIGN